MKTTKQEKRSARMNENFALKMRAAQATKPAAVEPEYYFDLDEETNLYCVFNPQGHAVASYSSPEEAEDAAKARNEE